MYYRIIENLILAGLAALIIVALFLALNFAQGTL